MLDARTTARGYAKSADLLSDAPARYHRRMELTQREIALVGYVAQGAADPRVRAALMRKSVGDLKSALLACLAEDLPAIARVGIAVIERAARPIVEQVAGGFVEGIFRRLDK